MPLSRLYDRSYPYIWGVIALVVTLIYGSDTVVWLTTNKVSVNGIFSAIFDIAAIITAFLFAFFGIAIAPGGEFVKSIFGTNTFSVFIRFIIEALALGAIVTLGSIPFMVIEKQAFAATLWNAILIPIWVMFVVAMLLAFFRVVQVFLVILRSEHKTKKRVEKLETNHHPAE